MTAYLTGHTFAPLALAAIWIIIAALIGGGIVTLAHVLYIKLFDWVFTIRKDEQ